MAIVINTNPGIYFSANGDLLFVVYEATKANDPVTYPDYKYVADVYIGAVLAVRIKKVPQPDNKRGVFNIGDIVRNYVQSIFNPVALALQAQQLGLEQFFVKVTVKFGEEYAFTLYTNLTVDDERTYFSHYNGRLYGQNTILGSYTDLVLSTRPIINNIKSDNVNNFIPYFPTSTAAVTVQIKTYDQSNSNISTFSGTVTPSTANTLQLINVGVAVLNDAFSNQINAAVKYFTVKVGATSLYQFNLICEPRFETYTVHFLNKLGGFETREFTKVSRKVLAITKTEFGKLPYTIDASGNVAYSNSNNVYNETQSVYASQYTEKVTINTDILSDAEYTWLSELVLSPLIYIERSGYFIPAAILQTNYTFNKFVNDKLTNLTIDFSFGEIFNAQYR